MHRFPVFPGTPSGTETCPFCLSRFRYGRACRFHGDRCDNGDPQLSRLPVCASRSARAHYGGGGAVFFVTCWRRKFLWYCMKMCMPWLPCSGVLLSASCIRSRGLYMRHGADLARFFFSASARSFSGGDSIIPQGCTAAEADRGNRSRQIVFDHLTAGKSIFMISINSEIRGGSW